LIRAAQPEDAPAIGRVQVETWRAAYRGIVWDATLAGLSPTERARQWRELLADNSGARFIVVAQDATDGVSGFAAAGPERSGESTYQGELYAIYVLPSHQRRGLGGSLVRAVASRLAAAGTTSMLLWVLEANAQGRAFYEGLGGIVVRTQPIDIAGQTLTEVAYGWPDLRALVEGG
jgi:ribosomal protein S18 acetylase RimI-like enzyme